jgi:homocysteine S-methyltransferase
VIPFLDALDARVLICDGAMGTMLYGKGVFLNRSFDELNVTQPDLVAEIHQAYVRAGADVLETNTFGANRLKLAPFGLGDRLREINAAGVRIARQAARGEAYVAGAIGPLGIRVEPWGKTGLDEAEAAFREQAEALAEAGVDLFMLETFGDVAELGAAVRGVRAVSDKPVVAQLTTGDDGATGDGTPPEQFTAELEALGADVIGLNCSVGPAAMLETIERIAERTTARLSVQPNAGRPRDVEGRNIYLSSPEYMASYARRFVTAGVRLVGGCCGTTPDHTRQMRVAATAPAAGGRGAAPRASVPVTALAPAPIVAPVARADKSRLASTLARGQFVLGVELDPPRGHATQEFVELGRQLRIRGVDALLVTDRPASRARMAPLAAALLLERQAGIETVLQFRCRERRLAAMQAELLGAHALGLRNILVVTGEPVRRADYTDATALVEADSIGVTNAVSRLNHGTDLGGQPIGEPTAFHTGVRVSPSSLDLDEEIRRYRYKAEAGAEYAMTEPVFDAADVTHFRGRARVDLPLVVTIRILGSLREAEWLANEVPGQRVPQRLVERMRQAASVGAEAAEGVAIAQELAEAVRPLAQGIVVSGARPDLVFPVVAHALSR